MPPEEYDPLYFEVVTPLGIRIRTTLPHWEKIITFKHPIMAGHEIELKSETQYGQRKNLLR